MSASAIERASAADVVSLATDVGPTPMQVGAIIVIDAAQRHFDAAAAVATIEDRIGSVPRLRQRLVRSPLGGGRPVWVDDDAFDLAHHVTISACPAPGDEQAFLDLAASIIGRPLPRSRPLWSMTIVEGLRDGRVAIVVTFHHVLADGIGGLAVLAALVDGVEAAPTPAFPRPAPSARDIRVDRVRSIVPALPTLGRRVRRLASAVGELRPKRDQAPTARSSLNRPTGAGRRLRVVRVPVAQVLDLAHAHGATLNDVLLASVGAALGALLDRRGESVDALVMSIPVSARSAATATALGNEVGAVPVRVPTHGDLGGRLGRTVDATRAAKSAPPGATAAVLGPVFRVLGRLGVFRWFVQHQRLVHTFVTNVHGPDEALSMFGAPVGDVIAVALVPGNVTVSFAALSYAGTLTVTIVADPETCPDLDALAGLLEIELRRASEFGQVTLR